MSNDQPAPKPPTGEAEEPASDTTPIDEEVLKRIAETNARWAKFGEPEPPATGPYADPRD